MRGEPFDGCKETRETYGRRQSLHCKRKVKKMGNGGWLVAVGLIYTGC